MMEITIFIGEITTVQLKADERAHEIVANDPNVISKQCLLFGYC